MPRVKIEGQGLAALIRNTMGDSPVAVSTPPNTPTGPSPEDRLRLEELEAARAAAEERLRKAEGEVASLRATAGAGEAALHRAEATFATERESMARQMEEKEREGAARLAELTSQLESVTRQRDHLRRTIDTELPQGEAKELLVVALFDKGGEHEKQGNILDAFHLYRRALRLDPGHVEALLRVATIYYSAGLLAPAIEALRGVVELDPTRRKVAERLAVVEEMARRRGLRVTGR